MRKILRNCQFSYNSFGFCFLAVSSVRFRFGLTRTVSSSIVAKYRIEAKKSNTMTIESKSNAVCIVYFVHCCKCAISDFVLQNVKMRDK